METNGNQKTAATVAQRRLFYPDGPFVSEIGFGAWPIGGAFGEVERQKGIETVQAAVKLGVTFIDTADYYENAPTYGNKTNQQGGSETVIGLALKNDPTLEGFVTTKVSMPPHTAERIHIKCGESLHNLQLDTIPLYQLHFYTDKRVRRHCVPTLNPMVSGSRSLGQGIGDFSNVDHAGRTLGHTCSSRPTDFVARTVHSGRFQPSTRCFPPGPFLPGAGRLGVKSFLAFYCNYNNHLIVF